MKTELTKFGNLKPGDQIVGSDGKPVTVTNVYEKHFPDTMYEIEMADGEVVQASGDHLWYCESTIDYKNKDEYTRLAQVYFKDNIIPDMYEEDMLYTLDEVTQLFGLDISTRLFIELVCRSLGHVSERQYLVLDGDNVIKSVEYYYSYNNLIEFLLNMKNAIINNKGYFYFGQVRSTTEIFDLLNNGIEVNIPHKKDVETYE